ncbi:MAG: type II secretion system protein GspE [Deltaproteobacteria bacterium SG8_13]|nr:MAG: type II secretion system protein GspE [Deltaproteobacteria bacterium SG8_13]
MQQPQLFTILNDHYRVSEQVYADALQTSRDKGGSIGEVLVDRRVLTETQLLEALSRLYDVPFWPELPLDNIDFEFTRHIPIQFLKKYSMVPLVIKALQKEPEEDNSPETRSTTDDLPDFLRYIVAMNDPSYYQQLDDLVRILGINDYQVILSSKNAILSAINISYDFSRDSAEELVQNLEEDGGTIIEEIEQSADLMDDTSDAPIIKLVNHVISQSIKARASDIHIEPYQDSFKVRYRVDGILYDLLTPPKWIQPALISRIKVMAKLNIAEKRLPQDGRLDVKVSNQDIDVRVSTIPTSFGERVVMRLLNKTTSVIKLPDLGISSDRLNQLEELVKAPNGIILVTGPTGSGKTTTLYAVLMTIKKPDINIITVEDPIEYQIEGISQIQVNPKIDLTFARGLRSIVRQDPDVILIGEIRDLETAEIAVQSALTGHLVFSTLHTNDSASAITRLVDLGVEPFLISSSVNAVVAQRLVRVLCPECRQPYRPDDAALRQIGIDPQHLQQEAFYQARGCDHCFQTGYRGRTGIFEIMEFDEQLKTLILKTFDANLIKKTARQNNMISLRQDGISKLTEGVTTIEEVFRVTQL